MRILFWNTKENNHINPYIASIVLDYNIDIVIIVEYNANKHELDRLFKISNQYLFYCNTFGSDRIDIWSNYINVKPGIQNRYYSIQIIKDEYILCCIHLISDLHGDQSAERLEIIQRIMYDIKEIEKKFIHKKRLLLAILTKCRMVRGV